MDETLQRIAIAEAHGWKDIRAEVDWLPKELTGIWTWPHPHDPEKTNYFINRKVVPDYPTDLNAMHRAIMAMPGEFRLRYRNTLADIAGLQHYHDATAAGRAEAFLKTLGKWV